MHLSMRTYNGMLQGGAGQQLLRSLCSVTPPRASGPAQLPDASVEVDRRMLEDLITGQAGPSCL